jgi:hypothetical protein
VSACIERAGSYETVLLHTRAALEVARTFAVLGAISGGAYGFGAYPVRPGEARALSSGAHEASR